MDGQAAARDVGVIESADTAAAALDPVRSRILACLSEPGSATTVASQTGLTRQKVNYHLRALEDRGLVHEVGTRQRRGLTERLVRATARSYVLSPAVLGDNAADPEALDRPADRLSSDYQAAVAARVVGDLAVLSRAADESGRTVPTLTIDTEIRFASASERASFASEVAGAITELAARYHDEAAPSGRLHRLVVASHPTPPDPGTTKHEER